jgi:hypothetical protein
MGDVRTNGLSGLFSALSLESQEILNKISFNKAVFQSKSELLYLHFDTSQYIDPTKLVAFENDAENQLKEFNGIRVRITSALGLNPILSNFDSYWNALTLSMKRDIASSNGLIDSCKCTIINDTLHLKVFHPMSAALFSKNETKEYIRQRILDLSGIELDLKFEFKEKHPEIEDDNYYQEKQKEEQELLKEVTENKSKTANGNTKMTLRRFNRLEKSLDELRLKA